MLVIANWRRDHARKTLGTTCTGSKNERNIRVHEVVARLDKIHCPWLVHIQILKLLATCCYSHWLTNWIHKALVFSLLMGQLWLQNHFIRNEWSARTQATLGRYSIKNMPLVDPNKILFPPLHIKLGLMKTFVKELPKRESHGLKFLKDIWFI